MEDERKHSRPFPIAHIDLNSTLHFIRPCIIFLFLLLTVRTSEKKSPGSCRYKVIGV